MIFAKPWADALIVLLVVLLFFGPKRLPALGKSLGEGMREFKDSITGGSKDEDDDRTELQQPVTAQPPAFNPPPVTPEPAPSAGAEPAPPPVAPSESRV